MDELFKVYYKEQEQIAYQKGEGWASEPIHGTSFSTCKFPGGYQIHFNTDSKEAYETVQEKIRDVMGHGKPQTKGDEIRAMTIEELAWLIAEQRCLYSDHMIDAEYPRVLDWLKSQTEKEN